MHLLSDDMDMDTEMGFSDYATLKEILRNNTDTWLFLGVCVTILFTWLCTYVRQNTENDMDHGSISSHLPHMQRDTSK